MDGLSNPTLVGLGVLASVLTLLAFLWLIPTAFLWLGPTRKVKYDSLQAKERFELEIAARETILKILGGTVLLVSAFGTLQTLRLAQEGQRTERFGQAVAYLDKHASTGKQLAGIYSLERIAQESPNDRRSIIELLAAYVRDRSAKAKDAHYKLDEDKKQDLAIDIQAILTLLGQRLHARGEGSQWDLDLHHTHLQGASLWGADLRMVNFIEADLREANFKGTNLAYAKLPDARLNGAKFTDSNLQGAALMRANFQGADLTGANFQGADLTGAKYLTQAQLDSASTNAKTTVSPPLRVKMTTASPPAAAGAG